MSPTTIASPRPINAKADRHFVTALARGLELLSAFRPSDHALGNQELARRCGLPKSTISRLTYTLTKLGYLEQGDDAAGRGGYRLSDCTLALGSTALARMDVRAVARPLMQELADRTNASVSLGMRSRLSMLYVGNCRSDSARRFSLDVGSRIPLATTAMGRAYLAACDESQRGELMERLRAKDPAAWPRIQAGLEAALRDFRELGCCFSHGDWQEGVNGIAIALRPSGGRSVVAINCGGPAHSLTRDRLLKEVRPMLVALGQQLQGRAALN